MRLCLISLAILFSIKVDGQQRDSVKLKTPVNNKQSIASQPNQKEYKPEIFTSGFIDITNSGQVNASARFIRLFIGEPGKLAIPISIYSGVSSNNFQSTQLPSGLRSNDVLVTNFINPMSGIANISFDGVLYPLKKGKGLTRAGILYHFGERVLTGVRSGPANNPLTGKPHNFFNTFGCLGLYFQTGAWERNNSKNVGISWAALRCIGSISSPDEIKEILPSVQTNGRYYGYSIAWGVEINSLVNIKVVYYKYTKKPEIEYYLPIYQFSFNYSSKK